jgi:DNA polymerase-3 subunit epsilon
VPEKRIRKLVILDTETTGVDNSAELIELAFCVCSYDVRTRTVLSIDCCFDAFSKPEKPISKEVSELTHITNEMLPNKKLYHDDFKEYLPEKCLVVAHNAGFDRRILERTYPYVLADLSWADSMTEIDWRAKGFNGKGLEMLLVQAGFWYDAHRAINDVLALLWLIISTNTLAELCNKASQVSLEVRLSVSYAEKDSVKALGFRFRGEDKTWSRNFESMAAWQETQKSLPKSAKTVSIQVLNSQTRFK